eukprot:gene754-4046_t
MDACNLEALCEDYLNDLDSKIQIDMDHLQVVARKLSSASLDRLASDIAPHLPLNFPNKAQEINFYVIVDLANNPAFILRLEAEKHFGCSFKLFLLRGFMSLYISGFEFTSAALAQVDLHAIRPLAEALTNRIRTIGEDSLNAHLLQPGDFVVNMLSRYPQDASALVNSLLAVYPLLHDTLSIDTHTINLATTAHVVVASLYLRFSGEDEACRFKDINELPCILGHNVEFIFKQLGVLHLVDGVSLQSMQMRICRILNATKGLDPLPPCFIAGAITSLLNSKSKTLQPTIASLR